MAPKPQGKEKIKPPPEAAPQLAAAPAVLPVPSVTPAQISDNFSAQGGEIISQALPQNELLAISPEKLRAYFVKNWRVDGNRIFGEFHFHGNEKFEKWIGLKNLIPSEYTTIAVRTPSGETRQGERGANGSFYDANGKYVAIWEGYSFEALRAPRIKTPPNPSPREKIPEDARKAEIPVEETVFVGDSLTVGMKNALRGANFVAEGGKQTSWMVKNFTAFLRECDSGKHPGVKRVVIFGGVNDIASGQTPGSILERLQEMYSAAKAPGRNFKVVACTIPSWDIEAFLRRYEKRTGKKHRLSATELQKRTGEVNAGILALQSAINGPDVIVHLARELDSARYPRIRDGLHFTAKASQAMAQFIAAEGKINLSDAA